MPDHATCHVSLAHVWEQLGEIDRAIGTFRDALRCDPRHPGALARLAARLRDKLPAGRPDRDREPAGRSGSPVAPAIQLRFALAQALDARGEFDRAAELTIEANALQLADFQQARMAL